MARIKKLKQMKTNGQLSDYIDIGADAKNIDLANGEDAQKRFNDIDNAFENIKDDNEIVQYYFNPQSNRLIEPDATTKISGECSIIKAYGKTIMIDTGGVNRKTSIQKYLNDIGVKKVDYLIISHWHYDHCTNFYKNMDFIDWSDCICYFPLDNPSWAIRDTSYYSQCVSFANSNCKQVIFPVDGDALELNKNFKIEFYNCGREAFEEIKEIEDEIELFAGHSSSYSSQYYFNDYSLFALVKHNDNQVLYSGDAMKAAQERFLRLNVAESVDIYKMHHHGVNSIADKNAIVHPQYCQKINPDNIIIMSSEYCSGSSNQTDVQMFSNTKIYAPKDEYICFETHKNKCYQKTKEPVSKIMNSIAWGEQYIFIDSSNTDYENMDGTYWRPFNSFRAGVAYGASNEVFKRTKPTLVIMPGIYDSSTEVNDSVLKFTVKSYDYYRQQSQFALTALGEMPETIKSLINKYVFTGYSGAIQSGYVDYYGIKFAPNDNSFETVKSKYGNSYPFFIDVKNQSYCGFTYCIFTWAEVINKDRLDDPYRIFNIDKDSFCQIANSYIYDTVLIADVKKNSTISLYNISADNILKIAESDENGAITYTQEMGKTLRNIHLRKPDWSLSSHAMCWHIGIKVNMRIDPNNKAFYGKNDEKITFYEWMKNINPATWIYRNDELGNGMIINRSRNVPVAMTTSTIGSSKGAYDTFGGNALIYQIGALSLFEPYDLSLIDIDMDLNNLKIVGMWKIAGTATAQTYANCPTKLNCQIINRQISGIYFLQDLIDRDGAHWRRGWDGSNWSNWLVINNPCTWSTPHS